MNKETEDQLINYLSNFCRAHPWHNVHIGKDAPNIVTAYIEIVPTDTLKYELDKETGLLKIDRPQKYSNYCPSLYGLIPQTYCGDRVGNFCGYKTNQMEIHGDGDPLDICVLSEKPINRADILLKAIPIGGFRTLDGNQADDKIIAVLEGDFVYGEIEAVWQCPQNLIERLRHYFLTYKDCPGENIEPRMQITHTYGREEAHDVIRLAQQDYQDKFKECHDLFKLMHHHPAKKKHR